MTNCLFRWFVSVQSQETIKKRISKTTGLKRSEESRRLMSEIQKKMKTIPPSQKGKKRSEETKNKMKKSKNKKNEI